MRVLVCGSSGCIGAAVAAVLRQRGHQVVLGQRRAPPQGQAWLPVDYQQPATPGDWVRRIAAAGGFDVVINAVGILIPKGGQSFERVHARGPQELFRGAVLAGVGRIIQVSALGVGTHPGALDSPYALTKLQADETLMTLGGAVDWAIVRPSLVYGPGSRSAGLFRLLSGLPVVGLPGGGRQPVQPVHVLELAECIVRLAEHPRALARVVEVAGPQVLSYRDMLAAYRRAQGLADPLWLSVPMPLMRWGAALAQGLPQQVFSPDTLAMLAQGHTAQTNGLPGWLGRAPTPLAVGLAVDGPVASPALPAPLRTVLHWSLAAMWLFTSLVTALWPRESQVLELLARCGFEGGAGVTMMWASCGLNTVLGLWLLWRPGAWAYAVQCGAVLGYTLTAAWNMPELTIDHCGPLVKNVPVLALLVMLWWTAPQVVPARAGRPCHDRGLVRTPHHDPAPIPAPPGLRPDRGGRLARRRPGAC